MENNPALKAFERVQQDHNHGIYGNRTVEDHEKDIELVKQALAQAGHTGLKDRLGKPICVGQVVHWSDGGDDLDIEERIRTRWDRIAVVSMKGILPQFTVIDSPNKETRENKHTFNYGNFIYQDTENYLTIVADSVEDYHAKFKSAGECMIFVLNTVSAKEGENGRYF